MRIAHLWYTVPLFGGAEVWAIGLTKALRNLGVESDIVCWKLEEPKADRGLFKVLDGNIANPPDMVDVLMNGAFMAKYLEEYDLICAHHNDVLFPAIFSKSLQGSQVACILHSPPLGWELSEEGLISYRYISDKNQQRYTIWKMFITYSDFFFTNSNWNRELYEKYENISPVPLLAGVDHEYFKPDEMLREEY